MKIISKVRKHLRTCLLRAKVEVKAKKIKKEEVKKIKEKMTNIKEKFRFRFRFCTV